MKIELNPNKVDTLRLKVTKILQILLELFCESSHLVLKMIFLSLSGLDWRKTFFPLSQQNFSLLYDLEFEISDVHKSKQNLFTSNFSLVTYYCCAFSQMSKRLKRTNVHKSKGRTIFYLLFMFSPPKIS